MAQEWRAWDAARETIARAQCRAGMAEQCGPRRVAAEWVAGLLDRRWVDEIARGVGARLRSGDAMPACRTGPSARYLARARLRFLTADSASVSVDLRCSTAGPPRVEVRGYVVMRRDGVWVARETATLTSG